MKIKMKLLWILTIIIGGITAAPPFYPNYPDYPFNPFANYSTCWHPFLYEFVPCDYFGYGTGLGPGFGTGGIFGGDGIGGGDLTFGVPDATDIAKTKKYSEGEIIGDLLEVRGGLIFLEKDILIRDEDVDEILNSYDNSTIIPIRGPIMMERKRRSLIDRIAAEEEAFEEDLLEDEDHSIQKRSVIWQPNKKWRKQRRSNKYVIPYYFDQSFKQNELLSVFNEAVKAIEDNSNIQFSRLNSKPTSGYFVTVVSKYGYGCFSDLGRVKGGLGQLLALESGAMCSLGDVIHELLHTIGFYHEQSRSDRDEYIIINGKYIVAKNLRFQFKKRIQSLSNTKYDFSSIMHYPLNAFSTDPGKLTIAPLPGKLGGIDPKTIGTAQYMSRTDIQQLNDLYP